MGKGSLTVLLLLVPLASGAAPTSVAGDSPKAKPAWLWADEERLVARFAPGASEARVALAVSMKAVPEPMGRIALGEAPIDAMAKPVLTDVIDGSVHPELLLPIELFNDVVLMRYLPETLPQGDDAIGRWREFGMTMDPDLVLREASREMVLILREKRTSAMGPTRLRSDTDKVPVRADHSYCRAAAAAFETVRTTMGSDEYLRFMELLYRGVAAGRRMFVFEPREGLEDALRSRARGCQ